MWPPLEYLEGASLSTLESDMEVLNRFYYTGLQLDSFVLFYYVTMD